MLKHLNVAVQGCAHGELDAIYREVQNQQSQNGKTINLLIIAGDFESLRDAQDLESIAVPDKYKHLNDFQDYITGRKVAPVMTIFIGGFSGVVVYNGLRIAGISGIYDARDYKSGHFEKPPYDRSSLRSVYHVRQFEEFKLMHLCKSERRIDICVSHDWPSDITKFGDCSGLLRRKPYFREDIEKGELGSPVNMNLLKVLQPKFWFSAHLHVKFAAVVPHYRQYTTTKDGKTSNSIDEASSSQLSGSSSSRINSSYDGGGNSNIGTIDLMNSSNSSISSAELSDISSSFFEQENWQDIPKLYSDVPTCFDNSISMPGKNYKLTRFLSLDKVIPGREFLQFLTIPIDCPDADFDNSLRYDVEWLAIIKSTHSCFSTARQQVKLPPTLRMPTTTDIEEVKQCFLRSNGDLKIPFIDPPLPVNKFDPKRSFSLRQEGNPQTDKFLKAIQLDHIWTIPCNDDSSKIPPENDLNEIDISDI